MKRLLCLLLALLLFCLPCVTAFASVLDDNESYMSGDYYASLKAVKLTGNMRTDIVNVALSQVGYHEGKSANDITGASTGKDNFTQYGEAYGISGDAWCATFIWWCAREAQIGASIIPKTEWAKTLTFNCPCAAFADCGQITPGDLVFFDHNSSDGVEDHVGLVVDVTDSTIATVEGNSSNAVRAHIYNRSNGKSSDGSGEILCVGFPDYERGNISFEYNTQFLLLEDTAKTYGKIGSSESSGELAPDEYLLLAQKDTGGERWYQVGYGLNSYYIKAGSAQIITKKAPPITGCDWLEIPDLEFEGVIDIPVTSAATTASTTQATTSATSETAPASSQAQDSATESTIEAIETQTAQDVPEYESYFAEDWLKYALFALLGILLVSIIVIIVSGIKVHNDDKKGMW